MSRRIQHTVTSSYSQMKYFTRVIAFAALGVSAAWGQSLDSSGNGMLTGAFHFRLLQGSNFDPELRRNHYV
jgi:hypothetical protein